MLITLLELPRSQDDWNRWSFHHREHHDTIIEAIRAQHGISLAQYELDPIPFNALQDWLQNNFQAHVDMDGALQLQSVNLIDVDFEDQRKMQAWIWLHFLEHQNAAQALKI